MRTVKETSGTTSSLLTFTFHIIGVPEGGGGGREKGTEDLFEEIMAESFPNLRKETDIQVQEAQSVPNMINPKRCIPCNIT